MNIDVALRILRDDFHTEVQPWSTRDEKVITNHLLSAIEAIRIELGLSVKIESNHYGSGYASFIEAWFSRDDAVFAAGTGAHYRGLVVLLSRRAPYFVCGEGEKAWTNKAASSFLPAFAMVDHLSSDAVAALVEPVSVILDRFGMLRLSSVESRFDASIFGTSKDESATVGVEHVE
jgi:hypothetical protein